MNSFKKAYFKHFAFSNFRNFRVKYKFLFFLDTSRARSVQTRINGKFLINEIFLMNRTYLTSLRACFRHEHVFFLHRLQLLNVLQKQATLQRSDEVQQNDVCFSSMMTFVKVVFKIIFFVYKLGYLQSTFYSFFFAVKCLHPKLSVVETSLQCIHQERSDE